MGRSSGEGGGAATAHLQYVVSPCRSVYFVMRDGEGLLVHRLQRLHAVKKLVVGSRAQVVRCHGFS